MLRLPFLAGALAVVALPVAACSMSWGHGDAGDGSDARGVPAQGTGGTRSYAVRDFDEIALAAVGDVDVRVGGDWAVTATGSPAALDKLVIERDGDALKLSRRRGTSWARGEKVSFAVTMPRIEGANIGGAGSITVDRVQSPKFEGNIGGSGRLDIRNMAVDQAEFSIGGAGNVAASGQARALEVNIGGSGDVQVTPLRTESTEITIAGSGKVFATATRHADVTIVGSGNVTVAGGAKCSVTKLGSGNVRCG